MQRGNSTLNSNIRRVGSVMAVFTAYSTVGYGNPVIEEMQFKTLFSNFDDLGIERRKRKWLYPKRLITLQYNQLSLTEGRTLFAFYIARVWSL